MTEKPKRITTAELAALLDDERAARMRGERNTHRYLRALVIVLALTFTLSYLTFRAEFGVR